MKAVIIEMLPHLIAGLVGGVLASIIVVAFALWWQKEFVPWLENRLYKGPRVEGIWQSEIIRDEGTFNEHTILRQFGYRENKFTPRIAMAEAIPTRCMVSFATERWP